MNSGMTYFEEEILFSIQEYLNRTKRFEITMYCYKTQHALYSNYLRRKIYCSFITKTCYIHTPALRDMNTVHQMKRWCCFFFA